MCLPRESEALSGGAFHPTAEQRPLQWERCRVPGKRGYLWEEQLCRSSHAPASPSGERLGSLDSPGVGAASSSPESPWVSPATGKGESVPAGWLCPRFILSWHSEETVLLLLLLRRNLVLPGQDLAAICRLMLSLFQCFPHLLHLLLSGDWR